MLNYAFINGLDIEVKIIYVGLGYLFIKRLWIQIRLFLLKRQIFYRDKN